MCDSQSALLAAVIATAVAVTAASGPAHAQQQFPTKPIRLVVGYTAGGQPDTLARMIGQKMSESWNQPVVIDNRPGGTGTLAAAIVAKAAPDGHTLLLAGANFAGSAALQRSLPYDPFKDFARVSHIGFGTQVLAVAPALGVTSVKDLIALAQAKPGKIIFASSAAGNAPYLIGAKFGYTAGIKVVTVAYKSAPVAMVEVMAGRAQYAIGSLVVVLPLIEGRKVHALAVFNPKRFPRLPDVPAMAEVLPEFKRPDISNGLLAPAGTPQAIIDQTNKEIARILNLPDINARLQSVGFFPSPSTPEEYDTILREQIESLSKLVRIAGLRAQ